MRPLLLAAGDAYFGCYAYEDSSPSGKRYDKLAQVMFDYKKPGPQEEDAKRMVGYILDQRIPCLPECDAWAVVPSSTGSQRYGRPHPLEDLVGETLGRGMEIRLISHGEKTRDFDPGMFTALDPAAVEGRHVLLIDDSWVTGNSMQSAAAALRMAGAGCVFSFSVVRFRDESFR